MEGRFKGTVAEIGGKGELERELFMRRIRTEGRRWGVNEWVSDRKSFAWMQSFSVACRWSIATGSWA